MSQNYPRGPSGRHPLTYMTAALTGAMNASHLHESLAPCGPPRAEPGGPLRLPRSRTVTSGLISEWDLKLGHPLGGEGAVSTERMGGQEGGELGFPSRLLAGYKPGPRNVDSAFPTLLLHNPQSTTTLPFQVQCRGILDFPQFSLPCL